MSNKIPQLPADVREEFELDFRKQHHQSPTGALPEYLYWKMVFIEQVKRIERYENDHA